jgi:hypothetical protein
MPEDSLPRAITTIRGGLAVAALAAALMALAAAFDIADGPSASGHGTYTAGIGASVAAIGVTACLALLVGVVREVLWMHLVGLVLGTGVALVSGVLVIVARTSDNFAESADPTLLTGGLLLVCAFWLSLIGVVIALVGIRMVALAAPPPENVARTGPQQRARTAPLAAILGLIGVVVVVTSALAVAYGVLALGDIRGSGERLTGRGMAVAGMALGILVLSLLAVVGGIGAWVAGPGGL